MNLRALSILLLLSMPGTCSAQVRPRSVPSTPPAYMQSLRSYDQDGMVTKVVLKNGLTVIVGESHSTPLVEALVWVKTGLRDEPADMAGLARVMEHMLSRGTPTRAASVFSADIKAMGGQLVTGTYYDHTEFGILAPAPQWKKVLEVQADALINPSLDAGELQRQAALINSEARRDLDAPGALLDAKLLATGFAGERLRKSLTFPAAPMGNITRDRLLAFFKAGYGAERILLVVCGDITGPDVLTAAVPLYAGVKPGAGESQEPGPESVSRNMRYAQIQVTSQPARLVLGFGAANARSADIPALDVLRALLGVGEGSVFQRRLKHQKHLIYGMSAALTAYGDTGYLSLSMELDPRDFDRCEIAAFTELEILKKPDPDAGELERAKAQLTREFWEATQTVSGRAQRLARMESLGSWKNSTTYLSRVKQVKWEDIVRVTNRYLTLENCAVIEGLPAGSEPRTVTASTIRGTMQDLLGGAVRQEIDAREKLTVPALDIPEESGAFKPDDLRKSFQTASILRGPEMYIREDHTMPLIHLGIFFAGGKLLESKADSGITSLLLRTMLQDSKNKTADQIYRQLETYGGILTPVVEDDYFGVMLSIFSPHVEEGLALLTEMIKSPKFDLEQLELQRRLQLAELRGRSGREIARRRLAARLFADFSYALDKDGTEDTVTGFSPGSLNAWYKTNVADKKPMVVVIGDTPGTSLAGFFVRNFSGSRYQDISIPEKFPKAVEKSTSADADWDQSCDLWQIGFQAPPEFDEDSFPLLVLRNYASGLAGRLNSQIMERAKGTFDVSLDYWRRLRGGTVTLSVSLSRTDEDAAGKVLLEELSRLTDTPVQYRDFRLAMNAAVADIQIRQQVRACQIADVIQSILSGKGIDNFRDTVGLLQDVKQTDLQEVARRVLKPDKSVTLRMHGKSGW
jgi:zinc protease